MTHPTRSNDAPQSLTPDLIHGSLSAWANSPKEAFEVWMDSRKFRDSSRTVYRSQWAGFIQYLDSKGVAFDRVDSLLIKTYLEGTGIKLEQRERIHRLIERAFNAIAGNRIAATNPAATAAVARRQSWRLADRNDDTEFLSENDHRDAIIWIETAQAPQVKRPKGRPALSSGRAPRAWVFTRNKAACAILLSAGLKPSELRQLAVNEVYFTPAPGPGGAPSTNDIQGRLLSPVDTEGVGNYGPGDGHRQPAVNEVNLRSSSPDGHIPALSILVRGTATSRERRLQLPRYACQALSQWLAMLQATSPAAAAGDGFPLFPRSTTGGALTVRSIEYIVDGFFDGFARQDGEGDSRITPQLLRNSFAADLFAYGLALDVVQERMGYLIDESAARLLAAWRVAEQLRTKPGGGLLY